jgi:predicted RNA-binding Zn ribbon-like protein
VFDFLGGRPVLDFLATIAERGTTDEEKLRAPRDLAGWAAQSGLTQDVMTVTPGELAVASSCARPPTACSARGSTAPSRSRRTATGSTPPRDVRDPSPAARGRHGHAERHVDAVLAALACDCLELVAGPDGERLRRCDGERCTRLFVDRSRGGRRRWCDMKGCGDRAKAAAYRRRRHEAA